MRNLYKMKAVIATNNKVKIEGARRALNHYYNNVYTSVIIN